MDEQIFLSTLAPLLSLATCIASLIVTVLVLILSPFYVLTTSHPRSNIFQRFLVPLLSLQLRLIYSAFDDKEVSKTSKAFMLVFINTAAPIYATGICMAAWVAAGFWFFAAILGDPNTKNKSDWDKDEDGKKTVLSVRRWWENFLIRGLR